MNEKPENELTILRKYKAQVKVDMERTHTCPCKSCRQWVLRGIHKGREKRPSILEFSYVCAVGKHHEKCNGTYVCLDGITNENCKCPCHKKEE